MMSYTSLSPKALELLVVVMVVKAHAPLLAQLADAVEHPAPPLYIVHVPVGVELDVAADLGAAQLGVVVQHPGEQVLPEGVHVAANHLQPQLVQNLLELVGRHAEAHAGVVFRVVIGGLHIAVARLGHLRRVS